ncbi:endonuclease III [Candidatus Uhrbacteria bacterium]|nr:endonuclease III [Candidatus Uhrbacteria bacterium]
MIRTLRMTTRDFPKPMGTAMVLEKRTLFELLVATVCSAQTKDTTTYPVMQRLFAVARTPEDFVRMPIGRLRKLLYPISYYNTKAKHLKQLSAQIISWQANHGAVGSKNLGREKLSHPHEQAVRRDEIPGTMAELLMLSGVGRKTANLVLGEGFGKTDGICVDTHVHRISNRLGIVRTKTREATERALMKALFKKYWTIWNPLLVMWGQNICTPISPKCSICPLRKWCVQRGVTSSR